MEKNWSEVKVKLFEKIPKKGLQMRSLPSYKHRKWIKFQLYYMDRIFGVD